jgi:AcrR family transcriptional regulator
LIVSAGAEETAAEIAEPPSLGASRKPRADAQRNRERLIETAKQAFADLGPEASLEAIARRAGVGIGTLYRHFPTRDAIVEAVYRREVQQLADAAVRLSSERPAGEALHAWMRLFVDYIATKKVMAPALAAMVGGTTELFAATGAKFSEAMNLLVGRAKAAGDIRSDVDPNDVMRAAAGFTYGNASPDWEASALRLIDILMDGLRAERT